MGKGQWIDRPCIHQIEGERIGGDAKEIEQGLEGVQRSTGRDWFGAMGRGGRIVVDTRPV